MGEYRIQAEGRCSETYERHGARKGTRQQQGTAWCCPKQICAPCYSAKQICHRTHRKTRAGDGERSFPTTVDKVYNFLRLRKSAGGGVEFGPAGDVRFVTELARRVRKGKGGKAGGRDFNGHRSETGRLELSQ